MTESRPVGAVQRTVRCAAVADAPPTALLASASQHGFDHTVWSVMNAGGPAPFIITKELLDAHPDFVGEWAQ